MAASKNIGGITVSIQAEIAKFQRDLKAARAHLKDFANTAKSGVPPVTDNIKRLNTEAKKTPPLLKQIGQSMQNLQKVMKIGLGGGTFMFGVRTGQSLASHLAYVNSWADFWREARSTLGYEKSGFELEMDRFQQKAELQARRAERQNRMGGITSDLQRQWSTARFGEKRTMFDEEFREFNPVFAQQSADMREFIRNAEKNRADPIGALRNIFGEVPRLLRSLEATSRTGGLGQAARTLGGPVGALHGLGRRGLGAGMDLLNQAHAFANKGPGAFQDLMKRWFRKGADADEFLTMPISGSPESYRQQSAIRRQAENIAKKHLKVDERALAALERIDRKTLPVAEAGIG